MCHVLVKAVWSNAVSFTCYLYWYIIIMIISLHTCELATTKSISLKKPLLIKGKTQAQDMFECILSDY